MEHTETRVTINIMGAALMFAGLGHRENNDAYVCQSTCASSICMYTTLGTFQSSGLRVVCKMRVAALFSRIQRFVV